MSTIELKNPNLYINRELSHINFNRRVLNEAFNKDNPLLERVKFLAIFSSNMDEFFMVRVSGLKQQIYLGITDTPPDGLTPREQLVSIYRVVTELFAQATRCWNEELYPELKDEGILVMHYDELKKRQKERMADYFEQEIFPVLTPLAFDPGHPFPHISNLSINLAVEVRDPTTGQIRFTRVKVPDALPRLIPLKAIDPDDLLAPSTQKLVWTEQVIIANLDRLFPGMEIVAANPFRVTRNNDMEIQEEEADDLLLTMEQHLRQRHFGSVVRLEVDDNIHEDIHHILVTNLNIRKSDVYTTDAPLALSCLWALVGLERPDLKDKPAQPTVSPALASESNIFDVLGRQDVLFHHPYESFTSVVQFVEAAAVDPNVLAIKQTLYRVGPNPPIVKALIRARENGKQVATLVELKARFDEESNIEWARALEHAGVHVVYGVMGLKTHCKVCMVVRRERNGIRRYVHVSTGNYNSSTARLYTDLGFMTDDENFGLDAAELFNYLTGFSKQTNYRKFLVAPVNLRSGLLERIERETALKENGHIQFKSNSLVDGQIIRALYRASQAGVKVDLNIRGICCLRPGVKGVSENIRVVSIIGRFLEHSRIYYFGNNGEPELYIGSADLMPRNIDRRVEVVFPVEDPELRTSIVENILEVYFRDTANAHLLQSDGSYLPISSMLDEEDVPFSSQAWFMNNAHKHA